MLYYLDLLPGSLLARMDSDNRDDKTTVGNFFFGAPHFELQLYLLFDSR